MHDIFFRSLPRDSGSDDLRALFSERGLFPNVHTMRKTNGQVVGRARFPSTTPVEVVQSIISSEPFSRWSPSLRPHQPRAAREGRASRADAQARASQSSSSAPAGGAAGGAASARAQQGGGRGRERVSAHQGLMDALFMTMLISAQLERIGRRRQEQGGAAQPAGSDHAEAAPRGQDAGQAAPSTGDSREGLRAFMPMQGGAPSAQSEEAGRQQSPLAALLGGAGPSVSLPPFPLGLSDMISAGLGMAGAAPQPAGAAAGSAQQDGQGADGAGAGQAGREQGGRRHSLLDLLTSSDNMIIMLENGGVVGLSDKVIGEVTTTKTRKEFDSKYDECPIELTSFQPEDTVTRIDGCGHLFSEQSIKKWLKSKPSCPVCRHDMTSAVPEEERRAQNDVIVITF